MSYINPRNYVGTHKHASYMVLKVAEYVTVIIKPHLGMRETDIEMQTETCAHNRVHVHNGSLGNQVERVRVFNFFTRLYLTHAGMSRLQLQFWCLHTWVYIYTFLHVYPNVSQPFAPTFPCSCMSLYVECGIQPSCLPDSTYSLLALLCSFSPSLPPPSPFCPAGTYMHVCRLCTVLCCRGTRQLHCNAALCALIGRETVGT